jgi:hypothetical protein
MQPPGSALRKRTLLAGCALLALLALLPALLPRPSPVQELAAASARWGRRPFANYRKSRKRFLA